MGSLSELSLDFKPSYTPKTISEFLREVSMIGDCSKRLLKIEDFLKCLEEERKKIDAFKRELPFCMLLMNDAIETVKEEEKQCRLLAAAKATPVLEEFMPIQSKIEEDGGSKVEKDCRDKMNWMSSAQLWSDNNDNSNNNIKNKSVDDVKEKTEESERSAIENPFPLCKYQSNEGAFLPFKGFSGFTSSARKEEKEVVPLPGISLLSTEVKNPNADSGSSSLNSKSSSRAAASSSSSAAVNFQSNLQQQQQQQAPRKARRCWSPELHRRFVNALQQLGGSQVATPKQIRELMKVDGLTNDEVKSHLQKYRLHTRRLPTSTSVPANQQVIVMGRIWSPHDHYQTSKQSTSQSGSPQGPLQLAGATRGISTTGGDSGEEEDGKSESYSWKGHFPRSGEEETE